MLLLVLRREVRVGLEEILSGAAARAVRTCSLNVAVCTFPSLMIRSVSLLRGQGARFERLRGRHLRVMIVTFLLGFLGARALGHGPCRGIACLGTGSGFELVARHLGDRKLFDILDAQSDLLCRRVWGLILFVSSYLAATSSDLEINSLLIFSRFIGFLCTLVANSLIGH